MPRGAGRTRNGKNLFSVLALSPEDCKVLWSVVEETGKRLEEIYQNQQKQIVIRTIFPSHVSPAPGNPSEQADKQLNIAGKDIVIFLFWNIYGIPPGKIRPLDGLPYESGTVQEFDEALEHYKNNGTPKILLYKITDEIAGKLTPDQKIQVGKVEQFFKDCHPDGRHPFLYHETKKDDFGERLQRDLLTQISELSHPSKPQTSRLSKLTKPEDWYSALGFDPYNPPFDNDRADYNFNESEIIPFKGLSNNNYLRLFNDEEPIFIFGEPGSGKTALRSLICKNTTAKQRGKDALCIQFELADFEEMLSNFGLTQFNVNIFLEQVIQKAQGTSSVFNSNPRPKQVYGLLKELVSAVQLTSHRQAILCLVDQLDEISAIKFNPQIDQLILQLMIELIKVPNVPYFRMRFFLPSSVKPLMEKQRVFRFDRYWNIELKWDDTNLLEILGHRLRMASKSKVSAMQNLMEQTDIRRNIDLEMVHLADNNPRNLIRLANTLLVAHVEKKPLQKAIRWETWDSVSKEWKSSSDSPTSIAASEIGFTTRDGSPLFNGREVRVPKTRRRMLIYLITANGAICSKEELISAGYPNEDSSGISDKSFYEHIRNLQTDLESIAPGWLTNERGDGYRLRDPNGSSKG